LYTTAEIKDALYHHGAVQVSLNSKYLQTWSPSSSAIYKGEGGTGKAIDFPNFLGLAVSCNSAEGNQKSLNHGVNIIGWGDCEVCITSRSLEIACIVNDNSVMLEHETQSATVSFCSGIFCT
jgi:hypothetical protein